jgi:hypothetical protein
MKYQLALQFPSSSDADYDRLISFEDKIEGGLGDLGVVDGHDIGSGEMNIFIHTDDPQAAFDRSKLLLGLGDDMGELKAGYRLFDQEEYVPIHPKGLKRFSVV